MVGVGNIVSVGGSGGGGSGGGSGIQVINPGGNTGSTVDFEGVNGIEVTSPSTNVVLIDGAGASGVGGGTATASGCFVETFTSQTSLTVTHNLGTTSVVVDVFDASNDKILPDRVNIADANNVFLAFNRPQTGKIVIVGCGGDNSNFEECRRYALLVS